MVLFFCLKGFIRFCGGFADFWGFCFWPWPYIRPFREFFFLGFLSKFWSFGALGLF